jgi:hypothetical protein
MRHEREVTIKQSKSTAYMLRLLEQYKAEGGVIRRVASSKPRTTRLSIAKKRLALELAVKPL